LRVVNEPEDDRVHVHRDGIFRQRLLGAKGRRLNALIDDRYDVVNDGNDEEESRPFDAEQFSRAKMTNFCQVLAIFSAAAMMIAAITNLRGAPIE
jgi:hypothetical protein